MHLPTPFLPFFLSFFFFLSKQRRKCQGKAQCSLLSRGGETIHGYQDIFCTKWTDPNTCGGCPLQIIAHSLDHPSAQVTNRDLCHLLSLFIHRSYFPKIAISLSICSLLDTLKNSTYKEISPFSTRKYPSFPQHSQEFRIQKIQKQLMSIDG